MHGSLKSLEIEWIHSKRLDVKRPKNKSSINKQINKVIFDILKNKKLKKNPQVFKRI